MMSLSDVSQLSHDESNLSRDVTHFLYNVVITNFESKALKLAGASILAQVTDH